MEFSCVWGYPLTRVDLWGGERCLGERKWEMWHVSIFVQVPRDCHGTLPSLMGLLIIIPSLPALLGRLCPPASTPTGVLDWLSVKSVGCQDHHLSPVKTGPNASLLADHPCNAALRIYCLTRSPSSWLDVPPPAACLGPSPSRGPVPLKCEPILTFKKKK